jgi:hypothetical protein
MKAPAAGQIDGGKERGAAGWSTASKAAVTALGLARRVSAVSSHSQLCHTSRRSLCAHVCVLVRARVRVECTSHASLRRVVACEHARVQSLVRERESRDKV